jgi:hypothetical protein
MRPRQEYKTTTDRYVYNRLRKIILEQDAKIRCSFCGYHKSENSRSKKWYSGMLTTDYVGAKYHDYSQPFEHWEVRYPNWKLVSKKPKQWMIKRKTKVDTYGRPFFEFIF